MAKTLEAARANLWANIDNGMTCPCCDQHAERYKRKLSSSMARSLVWLVQQTLDDEGWVNVGVRAPAWLLRTKELATTRHWGLSETRGHDPKNSKTRTSGQWRGTWHGYQFARGLGQVPTHVYLYNNRAYGFTKETLGIREALGNHFDYTELRNA